MQIKTVILVLVLLTRSNVGLLQNSRANNVSANNVRIAHDNSLTRTLFARTLFARTLFAREFCTNPTLERVSNTRTKITVFE